jgi:6-pyruvoyltetrahydropterin/6-carboxytetrahydropterin synthase
MKMDFRIAEEGFEYVSTKTYTHSVGLSCAFRQWRAQSHCRFLHGYALQVRLEFASAFLDERNWVVDFGGLKELKAMLEATYDHKTLVAEDDPQKDLFHALHTAGIIECVVVPSCGMESTARLIYEVTRQWLFDAGYGDRVSLSSVEVSEHGANSAIYRRTK